MKHTLITRGLAAAGAGLGLALLPAAPASADVGAADLANDIDEILQDPALEGATSGVVVHSLEDGEELYSTEGDTTLIPASNAKLPTSAAALEVLGTDYQFETTLTSPALMSSGGVLNGDLYLRGTGDPTTTPEAYADLAADLADRGVTAISGDLLADDTWFDDVRVGPDWDPTDEPYAYAAQISALTVAVDDERYDTGATEVTVSPGESVGDAPQVDVGPADGYVEVDNQATTGEPGSDPTLWIDRPQDSNTIAVSGSVPADADPSTQLRTVDEPTDYATHVLADAFEEQGIELRGDLGRGETPEGSRDLATRDSEPLADILVPFMKLSNNPHAEILVKTIGAVQAGEGSWDAGLAEMNTALDGLGVDTTDLALTDGSGLGHSNTLTADFLIDLLTSAQSAEWYDTWNASLPVAGDPDPLVGGTLASRMGDTAAADNVVAKTGTLTGVSALSGYVTGSGGEELVFSVVNNGHAGAAPTHVQDAIAVRLAEFDRTQPAARAEPLMAPVPTDQPSSGECSWDGVC
ncbi:D-alanyl-D-alanine carboxypeptidase/D-alanyl-D-alanine-endopeptidase [Spiractinospora alimapuensis]|uniref:D-alanyl-D-alanine carboxypeptidase/D-alanyl-D-alanine endopeptidase n=1 Tax=Spiractinospora alimapuensis TaxID=2820884 RepID=UPI001EEB4057|nr:D-alanyl-D-alanine carboxypeptidase/D-alanyl-D-alanine-endopeptidase [Spiractinospora alimapuensis]QVQ51176.1 D-alanyl-D-alanine carboxypeptidase/D-alanyl-D-alanine-endopeptidase [Spiractinospora alimapuensis]